MIIHVVIFVDTGTLRTCETFSSKDAAMIKANEIMTENDEKKYSDYYWVCLQKENDYRSRGNGEKVVRILERQLT